jgi:hypothetical protein
MTSDRHPEHDDDLHDRWHNQDRPDRISMGYLGQACPACRIEGEEAELEPIPEPRKRQEGTK